MFIFTLFMCLAVIVCVIAIFVEFPKWAQVAGALAAIAFVDGFGQFPK